MKIHLRLSMLVPMLILLLLLGINHSQALQIESQESQNQVDGHANLPWSSQYVQQEFDPPRDVGRFVSMALRPFDDYPVISYYDATNTDLMVAIPVVGHVGNCGTNNNWLCDSIDGDTDAVGMSTSIDIYGASVYYWKLGISYYDITNRSLKVTIWTCSSGACNREYYTVSSPNSNDVIIGLYSSLKFDSTGNAAIAYFQTNPIYGYSHLVYAYQVPAGGNCGEGAAYGLWECEGISELGSEGRYTSLDFSFDDTPYIAYYNKGSSQLWIAYNRIGGFMCTAFYWTCMPLDGDLADVGLFASLKAPQYDGDLYRIAYHDKTNGYLKYYDPDWGPVVVDVMGASPEPMGISIEIDSDGYPVIAYQYIESDFSPPALSIARPYLAYNGDEVGNCGDVPPGWHDQYWHCTPLDDGSQYTDEADYASMVVNSKGRLAIAYSEFDNDNFLMSLKFIFQTNFRFYLPITYKQ